MSQKIHCSNAERQQAYRDRIAAMRPVPAAPATKDPKDWEDYLRKIGLGMSRGNALAGAPREKRLLLTGVAIANGRN